jgi:hypothetical protein
MYGPCNYVMVPTSGWPRIWLVTLKSLCVINTILRGCLIPCLPRVPKKATQCVPECCILYFYRRNKTSFFSFHKNYLEKKREKNKRKTRTDNVNHNHRFTDLQMSIVKALAIDHAQSELVQVV